MTQKITGYNGQEPTIQRPEDTERILRILERQLDVLEQLATTFVFIPKGTQLTDLTP